MVAAISSPRIESSLVYEIRNYGHPSHEYNGCLFTVKKPSPVVKGAFLGIVHTGKREVMATIHLLCLEVPRA